MWQARPARQCHRLTFTQPKDMEPHINSFLPWTIVCMMLLHILVRALALPAVELVVFSSKHNELIIHFIQNRDHRNLTACILSPLHTTFRSVAQPTNSSNSRVDKASLLSRLQSICAKTDINALLHKMGNLSMLLRVPIQNTPSLSFYWHFTSFFHSTARSISSFVLHRTHIIHQCFYIFQWCRVLHVLRNIDQFKTLASFHSSWRPVQQLPPVCASSASSLLETTKLFSPPFEGQPYND